MKIVDTAGTLDKYLIAMKDRPDKNQLYIDKLDETANVIRETTNCIVNNRPFYPEPMFRRCNTLAKDCIQLIVSLRNQARKGENIQKTDVALFTDIVRPTITEIEETIREEIDELRKAEIVE